MAAISEVSVQSKCQFCNNAGSKYTCPRCNAAYCSVKCYKDPKHVKCSEEFYKDWVCEYLKTEQGSVQTKMKMLDVLKSDHEKQTEGEWDSDDDLVPSLEERLQGLDLDTDLHQAWTKLTEDEKNEFEKQLKSRDIEKLVPLWKPWWISKSEGLILEISKPGNCSHYKPYAESVPPLSSLTTRPAAACIKYNLCNIICAYAYIARLFNGDYTEFAKDAVEELLSICGALLDGHNFDDAGTAVQAVVQKVLQVRLSEKAMTQDFAALLFEDVKQLISSTENALRVLGDLKEMLNSAKRIRSLSRDCRKKIKAAIKKVEYMMSWAVEFGSGLSECVPQVELEMLSTKGSIAETEKLAECEAFVKRELSSKPLIEELN